MSSKQNHVIEISPKTILLCIFIPLGLSFLWFIHDLLFSLLIGFILMSALKPAVQQLKKWRLPHTLAVLLVYFAFVAFFTYLISLVIPPIITETVAFVRNLPSIVSNLPPNIRQFIKVEDITRLVPSVTDNLVDLLGLLGNVFSNAIFVISTLFFGLYLLMEEDLIKRFLGRFLDEKKTHHVSAIFEKAEKRMSSWFWGEITLMTVVGTLTYLGLTITGIKYALPLAVLAGLLEVIPNMGPIISAIPAALIGLSQSPFALATVIALYIVVQQLENNLIVPLIMRRAVGINPIVTLIALLVGGKIGGVLGVLLAIPIFLFVETIISEYAEEKKVAEKPQ